MSDDLLASLNAVLQLRVGEQRAIREKHLPHCTAHRYRDGWTVLIDHAHDRRAFDRSPLGWRFSHAEDVADFMTNHLMPVEMRRHLFYGEAIEA